MPLDNQSEVWLPVDLSSERNSFSIGVPGANMEKENQIEIAGTIEEEENTFAHLSSTIGSYITTNLKVA